jgi:hypothetical protein
MALSSIVLALWAATLSPSPCGGSIGSFDFEGSTQGAWTETYSALAFDHLALDSTRALCGRYSLRVRANFSPTGMQMPTLHRAYEVGHIEIKPAGLMDFTDMTVEAGILVDGPPDVRPVAFLMLVSDGHWVPGGFVTVTPGQWTTIQHHFDAENSLGPSGGTASVQRVFKMVVTLECPGCRWSGHVNVDAIRWYRGVPASSVASAPPAPRPVAAETVAAPLAPPAPPTALVPLRFWTRSPGQYHVNVEGAAPGACQAPCTLRVAPGLNTVRISGDVTLAESVNVPTFASAVEIKPGDGDAPAPVAQTAGASPVAAPAPVVTPPRVVSEPTGTPSPQPVAPMGTQAPLPEAPPPAPAAPGADLTRTTSVNFTAADAESARFSGGRLVLEMLVSAGAGVLLGYGIERGVCGSTACFGGALLSDVAIAVAVPPIAYGVGALGGGRGSLSSAYWGALLPGSITAGLEAKDPGIGLVLDAALSPILAPLFYEASSGSRAAQMRKELGVTAVAPFVAPLAQARNEAGGIAGFSGRF